MFVSLRLAAPKMWVSFLFAYYPKIFWDCSFTHYIVYVSLLATYDPNTWFGKLRLEGSQKLVAFFSLSLTSPTGL